MKINLLYLFILFISIKSQAQKIYEDQVSPEDSLKVKLNFMNTTRVDDLLTKKKRGAQKKIKAYRIQLFSGQRSGSNKTKMIFKKLYPQIIVENTYEQPYFKTKVGAYRRRITAEKDLIEFKKHFKSAFIFKEEVSIYKL